MKASRLFTPLFFVFALALAACQPAFAAGAAASLSWTQPTTRNDDSPLAASDIAEYHVFYVVDGAAPTDNTGAGFTTITGASNKATLSFDFKPRAEPYTVHFAVTAVDSKGLQSPLSNVKSLQFRVESTAAPAAPTAVSIEFKCTSGCLIKAAN